MHSYYSFYVSFEEIHSSKNVPADCMPYCFLRGRGSWFVITLTCVNNDETCTQNPLWPLIKYIKCKYSHGSSYFCPFSVHRSARENKLKLQKLVKLNLIKDWNK